MAEIIQRELIYFWYYSSILFNQIAAYWVLGMILGSLISVFGKNKLHAMFTALQNKKLGLLGIFPACLIGVASPLCMYGTIPISASFSEKGMREDWLAAFMMSSILLNPQLIFYSAALGSAALIIRIVSCFLCGIIAGLLVHFFFKGKSFFNFKGFREKENRDTDPNLLLRFLKNLWRNVKATAPAFIIGISLAALFQRFVPQNAFANLFGRHRGFGILMAASVGVPLYVCGGGTIPLIITWLQSGMSLGAASTFMIAGQAMKITNVGALKIILGIKHFLFYLLFVVLFALLTGFVVDFAINTKNITEKINEQDISSAIPENQEEVIPSQAEINMKALSTAYPDRISPAEFIDDDWTFLVNDKRFFYANGRVLPEKQRNNASDYRAFFFWSGYLAELPSWESTAEERAELTRRYEEGLFSRQTHSDRPPRADYFLEALWNISNRNEASNQQVQVNFLGHRLTIHSGISNKISEIEKIILSESETNLAVRQWINSLGTVEGWTWREVASSGNRSYHSYGIAIDILPRNLGGRATYWFWSSEHNPQWWNIPYSDRYHPPNEVIKTFESFGFIWGGKWGHYFDTMHFEYRPEVFILSGIPMENFNTAVSDRR